MARAKATTCSRRTPKKGMLPATMSALMASMLLVMVKPAPSKSSATPQDHFLDEEGLRAPSLESMPSTKVALSTLVTRNTKARTVLSPTRRSENGSVSKTMNIMVISEEKSPLTISE